MHVSSLILFGSQDHTYVASICTKEVGSLYLAVGRIASFERARSRLDEPFTRRHHAARAAFLRQTKRLHDTFP